MSHHNAGRKPGEASAAVAIYRLIEDPDQENKCSYQLTHNGHRVGEVRFENREVKVGNETVSTTCQIQLHVTKTEFEVAIAKPNRLKLNLETDNWITLNDPRGKAGAIFGHQTISNIESLGKSKYAKREMAIAELEPIFEGNPMGNADQLFDWCQKHYDNIDLKKLFSNKKRSEPWLLVLIQSQISAGKNSTERRQSTIENAHYGIGTNKKISKVEDGKLKVVNVNNSTNAPPVLFDDEIARDIAELDAKMEQMAEEVRNEQQTNGSVTSVIAGPSFAASYETAKQSASQESKPGMIISLIETCRQVERRLKEEDGRFKDSTLVIRRKQKRKNKCLDLDDDDDESMIESDDDIEPKKPPKRKASAEPKEKVAVKEFPNLQASVCGSDLTVIIRGVDDDARAQQNWGGKKVATKQLKLGQVGYRFRKQFDCGWHCGEVTAICKGVGNKNRLCIYGDGDAEHLSLRQLRALHQLDV